MSGHVHVLPDGQELERVQKGFYILETQSGERRARVTNGANAPLINNTKNMPMGILQPHDSCQTLSKHCEVVTSHKQQEPNQMSKSSSATAPMSWS